MTLWVCGDLAARTYPVLALVETGSSHTSPDTAGYNGGTVTVTAGKQTPTLPANISPQPGASRGEGRRLAVVDVDARACLTLRSPCHKGGLGGGRVRLILSGTLRLGDNETQVGADGGRPRCVPRHHVDVAVRVGADSLFAACRRRRRATRATIVQSGRVQFMFATIPSVKAHIDAGTLRAVAVSSLKRSRSLPNVPTVDERGYPGFEAGSWFGFFAPKGTPPEVVATLHKAVTEIVGAPAMEASMVKEGADPASGSPQAFAAFVRSEFEKWRVVVRESGATAD